MSNPYEALVRMIKLRINRQAQALEESKLQLAAAIQGVADFEDDRKQGELLAAAQPASVKR